MQVLINEDPFVDNTLDWIARGHWPAKWICHPEVHAMSPAVMAFRKRFELEADTELRIHVTADQRYDLFLDGQRIGRGPQRGDRENWYYETYDLTLKAGKHTIVARVWWLADEPTSPCAWMHVRPGFLLAADGQSPDMLNTGVADWDCKTLAGYSWVSEHMTHYVGARLHIRATEFDWGFETGKGSGWTRAVVVGPARNARSANEHPLVWKLVPSALPPEIELPVQVGEARHVQSVSSDVTRPVQVRKTDHIREEATQWNSLLKGESSLTIPANTMRRVIVDLGNYYCAYPEVVLSGGRGSVLRVHWAEALFLQPEWGPKGNRDEIEGKYFVGVGDAFENDGGRSRKFDVHWWESGRYLEILVSTTHEPLTIESFRLLETHYPYEFEGAFESSDARLSDFIPIGLRTLEMCSHETYMDCPYYEQLQYIGDTRLQALVTYVMTHDDRLPRKAICQFDSSRLASGLTQSRYPSTITQIIPPFSLWWIGMVYDYSMWRDDPEFVARCLPGVRSVIDAFARCINSDGLLEAPNGWNFMDWVPQWGSWGIPPEGDQGISGILNAQFVLALRYASVIEEYVGEREFIRLYRRLAEKVSRSVLDAFWDKERDMLADDLGKRHFSEHMLSLAILGMPDAGPKLEGMKRGLLEYPHLERATISFMHYLFEAYRAIGRADRMFDRLDLWFGLKDSGFRTTLEMPEPSRSDCHAWGAHPIYHFFATVLGIRPSKPGFSQVEIIPQLGPLSWAKGSLPHPKGFVEAVFASDGSNVTGVVDLPGIGGTITLGRKVKKLRPGKQEIG